MWSDRFPPTPMAMAAPGRVETAAVGLPRSRAGVNWKSQSGQDLPLAVTFHLTVFRSRLCCRNDMMLHSDRSRQSLLGSGSGHLGEAVSSLPMCNVGRITHRATACCFPRSCCSVLRVVCFSIHKSAKHAIGHSDAMQQSCRYKAKSVITGRVLWHLHRHSSPTRSSYFCYQP